MATGQPIDAVLGLIGIKESPAAYGRIAELAEARMEQISSQPDSSETRAVKMARRLSGGAR